MTADLARRRPASVAERHEVDWDAALRYLNLNPKDPRALALVAVCDRYALDPLLGHVSIYEGKPYIHYSAYLHIGNSSAHYQGAECVREWDDETYYWATVRVHRDDRTFYAERTGKSRKVKRKRDGGTYVDEHADAKAFAQAHRRALRLAFNVAAPDPEDDGVEAPAPEPVLEVARMVDGQAQEKSGTGGDTPAGQAGSDRPVPDPTSGVDGPSTGTPEAKARPGRLPPGAGSRTTPGPPSRPAAVGDLVPRVAGPGGRDPTSAPVPLEGDELAGADPTTKDGEGDVTPDDEAGPVDVGGQPSPTQGADEAAAKTRAEHATTGPAPPITGPSVDNTNTEPGSIVRWASSHGLVHSRVLAHLRREHPDDFGDLRSVQDLWTLGGESSQRAIAYLEAAFEEASEPEPPA